jgi:hypothetical protein
MSEGASSGFAAIPYHAGTDVAEGRIGLLPQYRSPQAAASSIEAMLSLAEEAGAPRVRLYMPEGAGWAREAARERGFEDVRAQHIMRRPQDAAPFTSREVEGVHIRALRDGEEWNC